MENDRVTDEERTQARTIRREVLGERHVAPGTTPRRMAREFERFTVEQCWGAVWNRDGLSRKTRSMLNIAMLTTMARWHELEVHVRGAITNGVTEDEIVEIILQAGVYGGVPVAAEAFRVADRVLESLDRGA
jgi:4-carboxymuconolactone decarboxylase